MLNIFKKRKNAGNAPNVQEITSASTVVEDKNINIDTPDKKTEDHINKIETLVDENSDYSSSEDTTDVENQNDTGPNPFADPNVAEYYRKLYQDANYECLSAFDPEFTWTKKEEKALLMKLNWRVAFVACLMFAALQIDRGNLAQAVADNLLADLGITKDDYNQGNTVFLVCFLVAEIPSQLLSKKLGPDIWVPIQMTLWSIVSICQCAMHNKKGFLATRALIGLLEGGFISDLVLWLSYFFKSNELSIRLSWFWTTLALVQIGTALLAFAILRMRGICGLEGWKWLFIIEGIISFLISVASFHLMVPSAVQTKSRLEPKGWFTEREVKITVNRVLRDDPSKGDMNNRQALSLKKLWAALADYDLWPVYVIGFIAYMPIDTFTPYFTLVLEGLGFSKFDVQLLTIPANVLHIIILLILTWFSEKIGEICFTSLLQPIYCTVIIGVIRWWKGSMVQLWPSYVLCVLFVGQPYIHAICVSWVSRNSNSIKTRAISSALYNIFVQLGNIAANNIYKASDAPNYHRGNMQLFHLSWALIPILLLTKAYYVWRNNQKDKIWDAMTQEEREEYIQNSEVIGNKRLDFRFFH
ncbi:related to putative tartrate transporter [Saccharomycodes ludwigii]|uniref:Related to putative tartrate transporter n=1 Tax=Saccharomycodes ludwigii TaxID=36035 RepID=A0A376B6A0_9ASCO|nr:hypothetical protein SCDLUD_005261 [Saccharomycodes ludwigii]KAH3898916.1 hypothetical protein SCDLUD_005261 [Saccharomycodes ludwigii]SSD60225.1 related to putative tartrate transporter [Saccharomycodes ludwigii]